MNISITQLKQLGFIDVSPDKNGMGYRLRLQGGMMELCYYVGEQEIRYQTSGSGVSIRLLGVNSIDDLKTFHLLITGTTIS